MTSKFAKTLMFSAVIASAAGAFAFAAPAGNFRAYMMATVAEATQPIWNDSYADKMSDQEWDKVKKAAADLVATMPTIAKGGITPAEQKRAKSPVWQDWTKKMGEQVTLARAGADAKDQMKLAMAGDALLEICEGCHMVFDPSPK
jgi:hypothetical protein